MNNLRNKKLTAEDAEVHRVKSRVKLTDRGDWIALALIAALGVYVRWNLSAALPTILHPDSDSYFEIAQRLWNSGGFGDLSRRPPLYPLLLWITGQSPQSGFTLTLLAQHAMGVGTALLIYLTARRALLGHFPALLAGAVCAVASCFVLTEQSILSETLYTFLLVAAGFFAVGYHRQQATEPPMARYWISRHGWSLLVAAACGLALALACLTRPIALVIFPVWILGLLLLDGRPSALRFALTAGTVGLAVLLPLLIRNQRATGSFALTQSTGRNLISVADLQVDYATDPHKQIRTIYHRYLAGKRGPDAVVVYSAMPELRRIAKNPNAEILEFLSDVEIDRALAEIAREAILLHPLDFLWSRLQRLPLLFRDPSISQWYALNAETYVPLVEFTGRINPEMTSRSILVRPLAQIDFPGAARAVERWSFPFESVWFLVLAALGATSGLVGMLTIFKSRSFAALGMTAHGGGLMILLAVTASLLAAILMQPPNLRYRLPTLPWEILLAAGGLSFLAEISVVAMKAAMKAAMKKMGDRMGREFPAWLGRSGVYLLAVILLLAAPRVEGDSVLKTGDFVDSANQPEDGPPIIREMPLVGRTVPMIYWRGDMPAPRTIETQAAVERGGAYHLRAAFSCGEANCANAQLRLVAFDAVGTALGTPLSIKDMPLAQERTDNDWFWEQIDERLTLPRGAARVRVKLTFEPSQGSLVIPFLALAPLD